MYFSNLKIENHVYILWSSHWVNFSTDVVYTYWVQFHWFMWLESTNHNKNIKPNRFLWIYVKYQNNSLMFMLLYAFQTASYIYRGMLEISNDTVFQWDQILNTLRGLIVHIFFNSKSFICPSFNSQKILILINFKIENLDRVVRKIKKNIHIEVKNWRSFIEKWKYLEKKTSWSAVTFPIGP